MRRASAGVLIVLVSLSLGCASTTEAPHAVSDYRGERNRENVVVFIHGVLGSPESSWRNASTGAYFPDLLQADLGSDYSIYLVRYVTPATASASTIPEIAERELQRLKDNAVLSAHHRVTIVAHSMGGLIAKRMLVQLNRGNRETLDLLDRVKGVIFLSTPAQGAPIAEMASWLSFNPQFLNMQPADFNAYLQSSEDDWQNLLRDRDALRILGPRSFCAYETRPTAGIMVVSRVYMATRCDANPVPMDLNHTAMASPPDAQSDPYGWVKARILESTAAREASRWALLTEARAPVIGTLPPESRHLPLVLDATDPGMVGKEGLDRLYQDIEPRLRRGERITSLTFNTVPGRHYYDGFVIAEYLQVMRHYPAFRYIVFLREGRYIGWMPVGLFGALVQQRTALVAQWINDGDFGAFRGAGMVEESIPSSATALDALIQLDKSGALGLGVLGPDGTLVGIASRDEILKLLETRLARQ
jgi:pimeloyl-ACP methyl ester carboxylesterase